MKKYVLILLAVCCTAITACSSDQGKQQLETRGHKFVRYADDFVILVKSRRAGDRVMEGMKISLTHKLKLK